MKRLLTLLLLAAGLSQTALAAPMMPGNAQNNPLMPPQDQRCSLSAGASVINYGTQSRWQLQDVAGGQKVSPGKRMMMVNVVCPFSQAMRLTVRGDKAGNGELRYGNEGSVKLHLSDAQLDGQSVQVATTMPDGTLNGSAESGLLLKPGTSFVALRNGKVAQGKNLSVRIELEPVMAESAARVTAQESSEAQLTLELTD